MYSRILVPLDGSKAAETVLPYVELIAARVAADVMLVSVSEKTDADMENVYRPYLDRLVDQVEYDLGGFKPKEGTTVGSDVLAGKAADEIVGYADENDMRLIAMAASGASEKGPWLLGHIAAKVLRATDRPVLLVRKPASKEDIAGRSLISKVMLPLDGSEFGEGAIPQVKALAMALDIEVVLVHVLEPIITAAIPGLAAVTLPTAKEEAAREAAALDYLEKMESQLRESGLSVSSELRSGSAASEIIAFAEEEGVDLIAMSTHGRSGISRWVFGSVTDKVLHAGDTPVLTVRAVA